MRCYFCGEMVEIGYSESMYMIKCTKCNAFRLERLITLRTNFDVWAEWWTEMETRHEDASFPKWLDRKIMEWWWRGEGKSEKDIEQLYQAYIERSVQG